MISAVFDAAPLITACKFQVEGQLIVDYLLSGCHIHIASKVEAEVAIMGSSYADGLAVAKRIARGEIQVVPVTADHLAQRLSAYALGDGERLSMEVALQMGPEIIFITDDYLAFIAASREQIVRRSILNRYFYSEGNGQGIGNQCKRHRQKGTTTLWTKWVKNETQIPESFNSVEEAGDFWDTHSTADYEDLMEDVEIQIKIQERVFMVQIEAELYRQVKTLARSKNQSVESLLTSYWPV